MPYGVDKSLGGDNAHNDAWMEKAVSSIMEKNPHLGKIAAIKIAKATMEKSAAKATKAPRTLHDYLDGKE